MSRLCVLASLCVLFIMITGCRRDATDTTKSDPDGGKQAEDTKPVTLDGEWSGEHSDKPHVRAILIEKNELPCNGEVRFFHKGGTKFDKPNETFSFDKNQVRVQDGDKVEVASPVGWSKEGEEIVGTHAHSKQVVVKVKLSGRVLVGEATVPSGVRLFLGNTEKVTISQLKKGKK